MINKIKLGEKVYVLHNFYNKYYEVKYVTAYVINYQKSIFYTKKSKYDLKIESIKIKETYNIYNIEDVFINRSDALKTAIKLNNEIIKKLQQDCKMVQNVNKTLRKEK